MIELNRRTKAEWRRRAIENREGLRPDSARICWHLERFLRGGAIDGWIVSYDAMAGEVDLSALAASDVGRFALTRTPAVGRVLSVHPADWPLEQHRFGYRQPAATAPIVADADIAAVLVPGLAFDHMGRRLGHGAGYYDRFLARLDPGVLRIGVSDGYLVSDLPSEPHDVAMTHLASEVGVVAVAAGPVTRP